MDQITQLRKLYFLFLPLALLFSLWIEPPCSREPVLEHGTSALHWNGDGKALASVIDAHEAHSSVNSSTLRSHSVAAGEKPVRFHMCFLSPLEFRSRHSNTNSTSLFPPLESSGSLAAFPSEPAPGTNSGVPMGAQQAGETTEWCPRCQSHAPGLSILLHK